MSYIYKITSKVNGKLYVGKTNLTAKERFKEHCKDSKKPYRDNRPLYTAMKKYGIDNFFIETVEECDPKVANEREIYWIDYYGSFENGYNATIGGDGKPYLDYDLIIETYRKNQNMNDTAKILGINKKSVSNILHLYNIDTLSAQEASKFKNLISVAMCDLKTDEIIKVFMSYNDAAKYIGYDLRPSNPVKTGGSFRGMAGHISEASRGKRKSAYGYRWKQIQ